MKLAGVYGDMGKGEFITVSEWMKHGNIMDYITHNHADRLELVRGFNYSPRFSPSTGDDSCTGQLRA